MYYVVKFSTWQQFINIRDKSNVLNYKWCAICSEMRLLNMFAMNAGEV